MEMFMTIATKMSSNRYLGAIRDAFIYTVPLTITAAFAVLINFVVLANNLPYGLSNPQYYGEGFIKEINQIKYIFDSMNFGALQVLSFLVVAGLAYVLSTQSKAKQPFVNALIIMGVFFALMPKGVLLANPDVKEASGKILLNTYSEAKNLFTALVVGILFTELLLWLQGIDALKIKLPESVPPAVANSFTTLFPTTITLFIAGLIAYLLMKFKPMGYSDLSLLISGLFQAPFLALAKSPIGGWGLMIIYQFFASLLWIFGLHGPNILAGFRAPTLDVLSLDNQTMFANGVDKYSDELAVFTGQFAYVYTQMGGSGATIGLIIATFLFSKREDHKAICRLALMPGIFEINEPITFGIPIVLNPIMAIPFVITPVASIILPGILTSAGILPKLVIAVPWVTPPIIGAFLATAGNFLAGAVAGFNVLLGVAIYTPFVFMANKQFEREEAERIAARAAQAQE